MNRRVLLLALHRIGFLRPAEKLRLLSALDEGADLSVLSLSELELLVGRRLRARSWAPRSLLEEAEKDGELLERLGASYVSIEEAEYPPLLREIHDPPFGLFLRGSLPPAEVPALAVVGTREASGLGVETAHELSRELALTGIPIVSGLARGIDAAAHRGALAAGRKAVGKGYSLAVLPRGIDGIYPPGNKTLAAALVESGGGLVSEYPPGTEVMVYRFPERNRIIAGLCRAVLVVEAPEGSGALITAEYGLEEGREVLAAAALLGRPRSAGIDRLVEDGAKALGSGAELLAAWGRAGGTEGEALEAVLASGGEDPGLGGMKGDEWGEGARLAAALRAELGFKRGAA